MTLKSLQELRAYIGNPDNVPSTTSIDLRHIADKISREVAERYVELPVDADGEVWTGKETEYVTPEGNVRDLNSLSYAIRCGGIWYCEDNVMGEDNDLWPANECRHRRKPTVEDVMHDYALAFMDCDGQDTGELDAEYAAKLREAVRAE